MRRITSLTALLLLTSCNPDSTPNPTPIQINQIAREYRTYKSMTPKPVYVDPQLAALCRGISQSDVDQARKHSGPHANTLVSIFMNDPAAGAFEKSSTPYPVGSIVIKEKQDQSQQDKSDRQGVGGMVKRAPGYDPAHGDWEYFYFEDPKNIDTGKIETGKITSCIQCHASASAKDYVFSTWAQKR
jgi:hypothetical protein